jgi:hypothetical protein
MRFLEPVASHGFGIPGESPAITGLDVIVVKSGRIAALYTFLDAAV